MTLPAIRRPAHHSAARLAFLLFCTCLCAACSAPPDCQRPDVFCAALVTDVLGLQDYGPNQDAWSGLQQAADAGKIDRFEWIESGDTRDYQKNITYFTDQHFDLLVTSGAGLRQPTFTAAGAAPDLTFVAINQNHQATLPNLIPLNPAEDHAGFLAGVLAARLTRTRSVAAVCETSGIPAIWRYCEGFRAGVQYVDYDIQLEVRYRDSGDRDLLFVDQAWGAQTADTLIHQGADVLFAAGGLTAQAALRTALEQGILVIGAERDQASSLGASTGVVTSIFGDTSSALQTLLPLIQHGAQLPPHQAPLRYLPLSPKFPEDLMIELDTLRSALSTGALQTHVLPAKP